jgi:hypothetical protein
METNDKTSDLPHLPISAQRLVAVIGLPSTVVLVEQQGGRTFRLFATGGSIDRITATIGEDAAAKLFRAFGSDPFDVPKCEEALREVRDAEIHAQFDTLTNVDGRSARDSVRIINDAYHLSERHIWRILKKPSIVRVKKSLGDPRQMSFL